MVDPHTAAAGTGTLVTVMVFIGSQLSPSVMIHRAVKKELKAGALLKKHGADIEPEAWERLNELEEKVKNFKLKPSDTTWGDVARKPFKLLFRARQYHDATVEYLFESRSASAEAMTNSSRPPASQAAVPNVAAGGEDTASAISRQSLPAERHVSGEITPTERQINIDTSPAEQQTNVDNPPTERNAGPESATANPQYPTYHSTKNVSHSYTTYFRNVTITAGAKAQIILHFGVGDVTVTLNPHQEFPDLPASYCGPLVLSGYVLLVPCNPRPESKHVPDVFIGPGNKGYDMEFSGMHWHLPAGFHMSVSKVEDDHALIASGRATVKDNDRLTPHYRAGRR